MEDYLCYSADGKVIGSVSALNGDEAWLLARIAQPTVAYLKPRV